MPNPEDVDTRIDAYRAWLTANGIDPRTVPIDADVTIADNPDRTRSIVYEAFDLDSDGRKQINERHDGAAIRTCNTLLVVDPPEWWQPYEKPTRDTLLAAAERVRRLHAPNEHTGDCEYCSLRDYPDYSVPHPCETVQALDGTLPVHT
ncbi:hypothetical protein [Streptomyces sp. NPDC007074]|uniref:hypothetical protein n=1 Tax=Streptomyces sp. NPDC007074 TaxID=3156764 RepID=UPI0033D5F2D1